jgi:stage II sporulation protein D
MRSAHNLQKYFPAIIALVLILLFTKPLYAYDEPPVRVGLAIEVASAAISAAKGLEIREVRNGTLLGTAPAGAKVTLKRKGDAIESSSGHCSASIALYPKDCFLEFNGKKYRGLIHIVPGGKGLTVINVLPLEEYLRGVVPAEISSNWEFEALKAQAVAARTYALNRMAQAAGKAFDLYASVADQVYGGVGCEKERTDEAIKATRGMVATYQGEPIVAYYSAGAGGCTADPAEAFGREFPYLKPVLSNDADSYNWSLEVTADELAAALAKLGKDCGKLKEIKVNEYTNSGKVLNIKVTGSKGTAIISAADLRRLLGYERFKSSRFAIGKDGQFPPIDASLGSASDEPAASLREAAKVNVEIDSDYIIAISNFGPETINLNKSIVICNAGRVHLAGKCYAVGWNIDSNNPPANVATNSSADFKPVAISGKVTFIGVGFGHGVGMSQVGANNYAKSGWNFSRILLHFYTGVKLETFYE